MRTTVTLDPDVQTLLQKRMRERGTSFKETLNGALRDALATKPRATPFRTKTYDLGQALVELDKATQLAGRLEDEEIIRKVRMGK